MKLSEIRAKLDRIILFLTLCRIECGLSRSGQSEWEVYQTAILDIQRCKFAVTRERYTEVLTGGASCQPTSL